MFKLFKILRTSRSSYTLAQKAGRCPDPHEAVELYSNAIKIEKGKRNPKKNFLSELYLKRGIIYLKQGVALLSSSDFSNSILFDPKNGIAHNYLGIWFTIDQFAPDLNRALEHAEKAVESDPRRPDFRMFRAIIKIKLGDKESGRQELEQLVKEDYYDAEEAIERFCK